MSMFGAFYWYFSMANGIEVTWASHPRSCLYHATYDGKTAMCGAQGALEDKIASSCSDPANDTMTCENCAGLVRRVSRSV